MSDVQEENMAYIGRMPCGHIALAVVDNPEHKRDVAKEIGRAVRNGYSIERVTCEYVRQNMATSYGEHRTQPCGAAKKRVSA